MCKLPPTSSFFDRLKYKSKALSGMCFFYLFWFLFRKVRFRYFCLYYERDINKSDIENTLDVFRRVEAFLSSTSSNDISKVIINNVSAIGVVEDEDRTYSQALNTWAGDNTIFYKLDSHYSENYGYVLASMAMFSLAMSEKQRNFKLPEDFHKKNLPQIFAYIDLFSTNSEDLKKYIEVNAIARDSWRKNQKQYKI